MDGHRFDDLTRSLAAGTSRRRVLKGLAGGVGATLATALALRPGSAQNCQRQQQRCGGNSGSCCSGLFCVPDTYVRSGGRAGANRCCPAGTTLYQDRCVPTTIAGELSGGDPTFLRCEATRGIFAYDVYPFQHPGGPLTIGVNGSTAGGGTLEDPFIFLYPAGGFNPAAPCNNLIASNDDLCDLESFLALDLAPGNYELVVTSFRVVSGGGLGTYTLQFAADPVC